MRIHWGSKENNIIQCSTDDVHTSPSVEKNKGWEVMLPWLTEDKQKSVQWDFQLQCIKVDLALSVRTYFWTNVSISEIKPLIFSRPVFEKKFKCKISV